MHKLPPIGQRIVKTSVAVFLCLVIYHLRGYRGISMPTEAAITAIICLQPYARETRESALIRVAGSLIGAVWGLAFLLVLLLFPGLGFNVYLLYALMGLGILVSLYTAVVIRMADASSLAAIVFLCVVVAFPDIEDPLQQAVIRMLDVFIGTTTAILVNMAHLPRAPQHSQVFFLRTADLTPEGVMSPTVIFHLNRLTEDGAAICLMSEHAPAYFTIQASAARLRMPMIVMDGAAVYDLHENRYLLTEPIPPAVFEQLHQRLTGLSYFIYTIHHNRTCVFHQGPMSTVEEQVMDQMRRLPYREYLDGDSYTPDEVVYCKLIAEDGLMEGIMTQLLLPPGLRSVLRPQRGFPGVSALYIYAEQASMGRMETRLMQLRSDWHSREAVDLHIDAHQERDAVHLLNRVRNRYEPVRWPWQGGR